jgi:hypothetical protein
MQEHICNFTGGMNKDLSPNSYPNTFYFDAKNLRIITDSSEAVLILSYPLKKIIGYRIQNNNGFNRKNIVTELSKVYSEIYSNKEKFGICCDELSDLELKTIIAFEVNGQIYLESIVESTK